MLRIWFKQKETKAAKVLRNEFGLEFNFVSLAGLVDRRKAGQRRGAPKQQNVLVICASTVEAARIGC